MPMMPLNNSVLWVEPTQVGIMELLALIGISRIFMLHFIVLISIWYRNTESSDGYCKLPTRSGKNYFKRNSRNHELTFESQGTKIKELSSRREEEIPYCKSHRWYQWVPFLFVFQGLMFLIPSKIWTNIENGRMSSISNVVQTANRC